MSSLKRSGCITADQEFLASFGVEIDETGPDRLQKALKQNRTLAEELASVFSRARKTVQWTVFSGERAAAPESRAD